MDLGAIGDFNKSLIKSIKGEHHLVIGGVYKCFRHPNYTGEIIGWTSSFLASIVAMLLSSNKSIDLKLWKELAFPLVTSFFGVLGVVFVLVSATPGLKRRQKEKYGGTDFYSNWIKTSWKGFSLPDKE